MSDVSISFKYINLWVVLLFILLVAAFYLSFSKRKGRYYPLYFLILVIRGIVVFILFLILLRPVLKYSRTDRLKPEVWVFIDNSLSVGRQRSFDRDVIESGIKTLRGCLGVRGIRLKQFLFSDKIMPFVGGVENIEFNGSATDVSQVMDYLNKNWEMNNISAAFVFSDGNFNQGIPPEYVDCRFNFPIYTVGIGDTVEEVDPYIETVEVPAACKVGDSVRVKVLFSPGGYDGKVQVLLRRGKHLLSRTSFIGSRTDHLLASVELSFVADSAGTWMYEVRIVPGEDSNVENNFSKFRLRINKKDRVCVVVNSKASFESRFLRRMLEETGKIRVYNLVENGTSFIPRGDDRNLTPDIDILILCGYPGEDTPEFMIKKVSEVMKKVPHIIFVNSLTNLRKLEGILFGDISFVKEKMSFVYPGAVNEEHPLLKNLSVSYDVSRAFSLLPPLGYEFKTVRYGPDYSILVSAEGLKSRPIVLMAKNGKEALFVGDDFWRWYFTSMDTEVEGFYMDFFSMLVEYLSNQSTGQVFILSDKDFYHVGEAVNVKGVIYDIDGNMIREGKLTVEIYNYDGELKLVKDCELKGGRFATHFRISKPGRYKLVGRGFQKGVEVGSDTVNIEIMEEPLELLKLGMNIESLRVLGARTNGRFLLPGDIERICKNLSGEEKVIRNYFEVKLYKVWWLLIVVIILLSIEWFLRRRTGYQ